MNGWQEVPISQLCLGIYDGPHATPNKTTEGPVFLGISNLVNGRLDLSSTEHLSEEDFRSWTRRVTPQAGDVVFSYETRLGEAAMLPKGLRCCLGRRMALMRPDPDQVDGRFLLFAFLAPYFQDVLRSRTIHGSTVDRIPLIDFPRFPIKVPPLPEQRAIAHILGSLDDKIELNRRLNQTLEEIARALFTSWFVRFDPVHAKAEGRQPEGMDAATAALFPSEFEDSALGPIPKGWQVRPIGDSVRVLGGSTPRTNRVDYWNGSVGFCTPKDLSTLSSPVLTMTDRHITKSGLATISSGTLPIGTVLMSSRAPIGYLAIAAIEVAVNQGMIAMVCDQVLSPHYVYLWTKQNMDTIIGNANGTTFLEISKRNFRPIPVLLPAKNILDRFEALVAPVFETIKVNGHTTTTLVASRDSLLPRLLSGEIRVPADDATVAEDIA